MRIGVISDTHGYLDHQVFSIFEGVGHIFHTGDIGGGGKRPISANDLLTQLRKIAPVTAVSGNVDGFEKSGICRLIRKRIGGKQFLLVHQAYQKGKFAEEVISYLQKHPVDVVVFGHSHQPFIGYFQNTLFFNPGSAGKKRFKLPRAVGIIEIKDGKLLPKIIHME